MVDGEPKHVPTLVNILGDDCILAVKRVVQPAKHALQNTPVLLKSSLSPLHVSNMNARAAQWVGHT